MMTEIQKSLNPIEVFFYYSLVREAVNQDNGKKE